MKFAFMVILVILLIFLIEFYFYKKLKKSVTINFPKISIKKFSRVTGIVVGVLNIYPVILVIGWLSMLARGSRPNISDNTFMDIFFVFPFWISAFIMIQSVIYFLVLDIIRLLLFPLYKKFKQKILPVEAKILFFIIAFFVIYVPVRIVFDYYSVSIRPVEYVKKDLNPALENFRLVFISDIQADRYTNRSRLEKYISKVNSLNPDLVLIGGDIITGTPDYIFLAAEYAGKIKSKYGVYSCVGDHDNWAYREDTRRSVREVTEALAKYNVKMIDDGKTTINVNGAEIGITFVTNTYVESVNPNVLFNLVNDNKKYDLKIFLDHQPRNNLIAAAKANNYDLLLAGHTHGGQITFLFPFITLSPTLIETKYVRGDFHFGNMLMIVTRGLGMSLVPMRLNSTPEVTAITLRNAD